MDPTEDQINAFYEDLFQDPEFLAELERIRAELIEKFVQGEPFDPPWEDHGV
jgi:hypothetical protein